MSYQYVFATYVMFSSTNTAPREEEGEAMPDAAYASRLLCLLSSSTLLVIRVMMVANGQLMSLEQMKMQEQMYISISRHIAQTISPSSTPPAIEDPSTPLSNEIVGKLGMEEVRYVMLGPRSW